MSVQDSTPGKAGSVGHVLQWGKPLVFLREICGPSSRSNATVHAILAELFPMCCRSTACPKCAGLPAAPWKHARPHAIFADTRPALAIARSSSCAARKASDCATPSGWWPVSILLYAFTLLCFLLRLMPMMPSSRALWMLLLVLFSLIPCPHCVRSFPTLSPLDTNICCLAVDNSVLTNLHNFLVFPLHVFCLTSSRDRPT